MEQEVLDWLKKMAIEAVREDLNMLKGKDAKTVQEENEDVTERSLELQEDLIESVDELTTEISELNTILRGIAKKL